jgi:CheY-like chemotaxis protein
MRAATSKRRGGSAAAVLDFAVAQILGDDAVLGALPAVLDRMVAAFGLRAALAFQPSAGTDPAVLAVHPPGAADQALLARIGVMAMAGRLAGWEFEVIHTADPVTALRLAADEHWDLVVTDLDLPGMTGPELLGALRRLVPALPVAVVSAHVLDGAPAGLLGPADRYLEKPLRVDQLIATATALIGRGRPLSDDLRRGNLRA